jgi:hypothetical protein
VAFAVLAASLCSAAAIATPCVFEPVPMQPRSLDSKLDPNVTERVRGATTMTPFTIQSRANGPVKLRWQRFLQATPLELYERLTVTVSRDGGTSFGSFCETRWVAVAQLNVFSELTLDAAGPVIWRAEVHEENRTPTLTVLDEERPTLMLIGALEGDAIVRPPPLPFFDQQRSDRLHSPPRCDVTKQSATTDAIPVKATSIAQGGLQIEGTIHAVSGRTLYLEIERASEGPPVRVVLSAKPLGYGIPPRPVCVIEVTSSTLKDDEWISATAPWAMGVEFRWRITLGSDATSPAIKYVVHRERPPSMAATLARAHASDAYSCTNIDMAKQTPVDPANARMFQGAYALTIHTNLHGEGVTGQAYRQTVDAILTSIDNWRLVCTACTPYQFAVIDIDGQVYVAPGMLQGTPENYRATFNDGYPWVWRFSPRKSTGLFSSAISFVPVSGSARQRQRFCLQQDEDEYRFAARQSPLCRPSPPSSDEEMVVNFEWKRKGLGCDTRPSVVACWNGTDRIELNLKHYSFYIGDTGDTVLGDAAKGADLVRVFTHEVGHWLGLDHIVGDGNIMSDELEHARCIDDRDVQRINAIAHGTVRPSHKPEALLYD